MPISKIDTPALKADAVDNTILDLASNYAFSGTVSGAGGGKLLQVARTVLATTVETSSSSFATALTSASFTMASSSNSLLVIVPFNVKVRGNGSVATPECYVRILNNEGTELNANMFYFSDVANNNNARVENAGCLSAFYSPSSTSPVIYLQYKASQGAIQMKGSDNISGGGTVSNIILQEISA